MEPDKSLEEALFRSHQATEKSNQAQSKLYNMGSGPENPEAHQSAASQPELHETPRNLLQSWDTLRQLDEELEAKKSKKKHNTDTKPKA
ncbi:hypothetical protein [uncultured Pontibacter sp.]|uniref:hypothetical protein n=1 Tax=uncultured Pontibacter sp. TaxID=453356 RepID=UPI002611099F|nr:hypothetical protein [uncultured Pontibacter sp.]